MDFKLFEDYTEYITRQIMSKKKQKEVFDEYYSHLMEEYERHTYLGKSHIEAQVSAIESMGDKDALKVQFGQLYSIIPMDYMRSSLNFIIWGILFTTVHVNFFPGCSAIIDFIGEAFILYGLFKLRRTDKKLNIALVLHIIGYFIGLIIQAFTLWQADGTEFELLSSLILRIPLSTIMFGFMFAGISSICKTLEGKGFAKPKMTLAFISYVIMIGIVVFATVYETQELAIFVPLFLIIPLWQLRNAKKVLANETEEFDLKTILDKTEKGICWALIIAFAIVPVISMVAVSSSAPKTEEFNQITDTVNLQDARDAELNMITLGFPSEYICDLPDYEIIRYKDAIHLETADPYNHTLGNSFGIDRYKLKDQQFVFFFADGEVRTLKRVEFDDDYTPSFRCGMYLGYHSEDFVCDNGKEDFAIALSENNAKTVVSKPISEYTADFDFTTGGFEFKFPRNSKNCRAYVSKTAYSSYPNKHIYSAIDGLFCIEEFPIYANQQSVNQYAINWFAKDMILFGFPFDQFCRVQLYNTIDMQPEFFGSEENTITEE